jgi:glycerol-3-phosphate dehydrogenase
MTEWTKMRPNDADIVVIGGGVVGCAVARRFTLEGARVGLLERGADILSGASKANAGILHTGFDAPPGSLELRCMQQGRAEYLAIRDRLGLPLLETGAIVAAWTADEQDRLESIAAHAHRNGVADVRLLDSGECRAREPHLARDLCGGLLVPGEHVIDPWSAPLAYLLQAVRNGAALHCGADVLGGEPTPRGWRLRTTAGVMETGLVVNCAGLRGDLLEHALLGGCAFEIRPRKGQFVVFDKAAAGLLGSIILPVPTPRTKGVLLTRTIFGNLMVGPTAEDQVARDRADIDPATTAMLAAQAAKIVPALAHMPITATFAGLRPASDRAEYRIAYDHQRQWVSVGGIRSTGLTAALGIAAHVYGLYRDSGAAHTKLASPLWPTVPNLAEHLPRDWQRPGHGPIVCRCEMVTEGDVAAALDGPLAARDWGGLRRRTRVAMGVCRGRDCAAALATRLQ